MSSFDRRSLLALPVLLAACGFTPVYGPGGTAANLRGKVLVNAPETEEGYILVRELETILGRTATPEYELLTNISVKSQGQAITSAGDITRYSVNGHVNYTLRRAGSEEVLTMGSTDNFTGYSATGSTVETLAAERDARERLMVILAHQIAAQLYSNPDLGA